MPTTLTPTLERLGRATRGPRLAMRGRHLWVASDLSVDDGACAAFALTFEGQGSRLRGTARGPSIAVLRWTFHTLAVALKCTLHDESASEPITPAPDVYRSAAVTYLEGYERDIVDARARRAHGIDAEDGDARLGQELLEWLAREEQIALASGANLASLGASLPLNDASALYELLLESDDVEDVFVSETEFSALLDRFRSRITPRR